MPENTPPVSKSRRSTPRIYSPEVYQKSMEAQIGNGFWKLAVEAHGRCSYCELDGSQEWRILQNFTIDHLIPLPRKDPQREAEPNLVFACRACNTLKEGYDASNAMLAPTSSTRAPYISAARVYMDQRRGPYYPTLCAKLQSGGA